jgi:site-specific DNA recombinase
VVDVIVVYKSDRLTRSLADFARIVEPLDRQGASFVSITQQFNTTTSMGRLTLNVLLSFAQFERAVTGERIRDKIAASKRKGMWMGGNLPLGYDLKDRQLVINDREAETVRYLFQKYRDLGTVSALQAELSQQGIASKAWVSGSGRRKGGEGIAEARSTTCCAIHFMSATSLIAEQCTMASIRRSGRRRYGIRCRRC